jgi:hypothetical protein
MKVNCDKCGVYCGEVRDATLRKGWKIICQSCSEDMKRKAESDYDYLSSVFFGEKKKK